MRACLRACVRVCVRACLHACVRTCVHACVFYVHRCVCVDSELERKLNLLLLSLMQYIMQIMSYYTPNGIDLFKVS